MEFQRSFDGAQHMKFQDTTKFQIPMEFHFLWNSKILLMMNYMCVPI